MGRPEVYTHFFHKKPLLEQPIPFAEKNLVKIRDYTFFFISNSIFDPLSLIFSKIVATWLATVEPQIVNS